MKRKNTSVKRINSNTVLDIVANVFSFLILVIALYPLLYVLSMAISNPIAVVRGKVWLYPVGFDFTALKAVFNEPKLFTYYGNTIWYTVVGTVLSVSCTMLAAYPLSRRSFKAKKLFTIMITFTMFFGGGLIPSFLVVAKFLRMYNTRWAIVVPGMAGAWNILMARNFVSSLPEELFESAKVDGASEILIFGRIALPLCKPVMSVLTVYSAIGYWNGYMGSILYHTKDKLRPLGLYVRKLAIEGVIGNEMEDVLSTEEALSSMQIKYAAILVAVAPLIMLYPFFGKYMKKGLMVGAVKG